MLIWKFIIMETLKKLPFFKLMNEYSILRHKKVMLTTGMKLLISIHTELLDKPMNTSCHNLLIWDFIKSKLRILLFTKMADTSDWFMNHRTIYLPPKCKINSTFLFTSVTENSTSTDKTLKPPLQLLHKKMVGFRSLWKFQTLSVTLLIQKSLNFSLPITGLSGMPTESKILESIMIFM